MTAPTIPSKDPADSDHLAGTFNTILKKVLQNLQCCLPVQVIAYDRVKNKAMLRPMITMITTAGQPVSRAQVASAPVLAYGGGGFCINFPLKEGDIGWMYACDRDISLFVQSLEESKPNTFRLHDFADAMFIPDAFNQYTFSPSDAANMVIQSYDGTVKISLTPDSININSTNQVNVNTQTANVNAENMNFAGSGLATFNIAAKFNQPVTMTDGLTTNAATIGGIAFGTHKHTGITVGGATSGGPTS